METISKSEPISFIIMPNVIFKDVHGNHNENVAFLGAFAKIG